MNMFPRFSPETEARLQKERAMGQPEKKYAIKNNWHELKPEDHDKAPELVEMKVREFYIEYTELADLDPWDSEEFLDKKLRANGFDPTAMIERTDDHYKHRLIIRQYYREEK